MVSGIPMAGRRGSVHISDLTEERLEACPYCGEPIAAVIDCSGGSQEYVEDCPVCCQPILFRVTIDPGGELSGLELHRENE
jgi:hypothetical protein